MQVAVTVRSGDGWRAKGTHTSTHNVLRIIGLPVCLCRSGTCDQGSFPLGRIHRVRRASAACRTFGCTVWCGHGVSQSTSKSSRGQAQKENERQHWGSGEELVARHARRGARTWMGLAAYSAAFAQ